MKIGPVRRLTMNRPKTLNALNGELIEALSGALAEAAEDDAVSVVILRGSGRAFCAGYDLAEDADSGTMDSAAWYRELRRSTDRMLEFTKHPKPTIAQVHSYCLAGGTDLMLACDLAVAADDSYFELVLPIVSRIFQPSSPFCLIQNQTLAKPVAFVSTS